MKVTGEYVLIEQIDTKKDTKIILSAKSEDKGYITSFKIKEIGPKVPEDWGLEVGKAPIFTSHVSFVGLKVTTPDTAVKFKSADVVVHYIDIIGIE